VAERIAETEGVQGPSLATVISPNLLLLNWLLALPFFAAVAAELFPRFTMGRRSPRQTEELARGPFAFGAVISAMGLSLSIHLLSLVARGVPVTADYLWTRDLYHLRLQGDPLSAPVALAAYGFLLVLFLHLAGLPPRPQDHHQAALLFLAQGGVIGAALAADLILLLFFLGLAVTALALLICLEDRARGEAMLLNGYLAGLPVLLAALLMWRQSDDPSLAQLPLLLLTKDTAALRAPALLALFGLLPLVAGAPGYGRWWLAAKAAPRAVGMTANLLLLVGGMAMLRLLPGSLLLPALPGLGSAALAAGLILLWAGALRGWRAADLRGRAAGITVAQAGYLLVALAGATSPTASPAFLRAASLHLLLAPVAVLAVWLAAATVLARIGTDTLIGLSGLLGKMPVAGLALLVGGLSLVGLPPLAGFREQALLLPGIAAEAGWMLLAALLAADLLIAYLVLDAFRRVFLRGQPPSIRPSSLGLEISLVLLILALVLGGVWAGPLNRWSDLVCHTVLSLRPMP